MVDLRRGVIEEIVEHGMKTKQGMFEFDILICATGFDAMTGTLINMNIEGANGAQLKKEWEAGPRTYLGLQIAGFPNMFTVTGPGSPSVLSSMIVSVEQHVDFIANAIAHMKQENRQIMQASPKAPKTNPTTGGQAFRACKIGPPCKKSSR